MILMIDNYDSFTYNVYQYIGSLYPQIQVVRNDEITIDEIRNLQNLEALVISPGPGYPDSAGISKEAIKTFGKEIPVLGICLGHQALARAFGAELRQLSAPLHGHPTTLTVTDAGDLLLQKIAPPLIVGRYHSWVVDPDSMPEELIASSHDEAGHIMSFYHRNLPIHGVQFHPESCISNCGPALIRNWLATC